MITPVSSLAIFVSLILAFLCEKIDDPTLGPEPFSISSHVGILKKEMIDANIATTNRDKVADLWFHRKYDERRQISDFYDKNCCPISAWGYYCYRNCPLSKGFLRISDGNMQDLYENSLIPPEGILAIVIFKSITGNCKEVGAIEEAVCANDKDMKDKIEQFYQSNYKDGVANALGTFRKDDKDYQHVMLNYCWKGFCQDKRKIKPEDADKEAQALRAIDPDKDKENFKKKLIELLDKHCESDMKLIFEKYRKDKDGIDNAVEKAFEVKRVRRAYNRMVRYVENNCKFYSDELNEAVDGCGTNAGKINRIILTRCERDLKCILDKYKEAHKETFTERLRTDTTEDRWLTSLRYLCGKT